MEDEALFSLVWTLGLLNYLKYQYSEHILSHNQLSIINNQLSNEVKQTGAI